MYKSNAAPSYVPKASSTPRVAPTAYDVALLIATTARYFNVAPDDITGQAHDTQSRRARVIVNYLLREDGDMAWAAIGRVLGRDRASTKETYYRIADEVAFNDLPIRLALETIRHDVAPTVDHTVAPTVDSVDAGTTLADQHEARYWYARAMRDARERSVVS